MTDTVSAADPGCLADSHPDAKLLELRTLLVASEARSADCRSRVADLTPAFAAPDIPFALLFRGSDTPHVCRSVEDLEQCWFADGWRPFYGDLSGLASRAERLRQLGDGYIDDLFSAADRARTAEILAAHAEWAAAIRDAERACGLDGLYEALERELDTAADLVRDITATPATTLEGLAAKARTALARQPADAAPTVRHLGEPIALSILEDLERLGLAAARERNVA